MIESTNLQVLVLCSQCDNQRIYHSPQEFVSNHLHILPHNLRCNTRCSEECTNLIYFDLILRLIVKLNDEIRQWEGILRV